LAGNAYQSPQHLHFGSESSVCRLCPPCSSSAITRASGRSRIGSDNTLVSSRTFTPATPRGRPNGHASS
jgi:hypothetical protein